MMPSSILWMGREIDMAHFALGKPPECVDGRGLVGNR